MTSVPETISLGCRLNAYEAERMAKLAADAGERDAVIVNTCAVTNEAVRQSRQAIRKAARGGRRVIATGCAVQTDPDGFAAMPEVARTLGNAEKLDPSSWARPHAPEDVFARTALPRAPSPAAVAIRAHLEVQNGCDHRCTFCIIPYGRGQARSKRIEEVVAEARDLAALGAKEVVLTGVDLTSWGPDLGEERLGHLVEALLAALPGDVAIRLSSIDGAEVDDRLFALLTQEERVAPYAHLSLQSGADMILKRMKRRHSRADAVRLSERLRAARPNIALGADLIAGFPTETEEMAAETRALVRDCGLSYVHVFPFSPRTGTPAARMPQVARAVVKARAAALRAAAEAALQAHLDAKLNRPQTLLVEQTAAGRATGKTPDFTDIVCEGAAAPGTRLSVLPQRRDGRRLLAVRA
ncbi:threonylcarbamoyladenosine tRNA methylthiotransferase MtaB [Parvularcula dongshanensis]|uniref:Threonylcarbamoyladenosine tRNA methylthiotransferase MtaB n=1 Tax=Parvularcula dongshanensis TaxID=1173995 RepID=A0A840I160_9PROT|nr:threonylcarbamoyladenosine tRNA methylthiotransferase MtaB [Parvularcula dongshanensis]